MDSQAPEVPLKTAHRGHHRHASSQRPTASRRTTKGPLDLGEDPLSGNENLHTPTSNLTSPISPPPVSMSRSRSRSPGPPSPVPPSSPHVHPIPVGALSHLLRPSLFHPLPPVMLPYTLPPPNTSMRTLLETGHFRAAAMMAARKLASPPNPTAPLTTPAVFDLWLIRLAVLCLLGLEHIAADESRALGDAVDGPVYRDPRDGYSALPWALRVMVVRLQARAEGDVGRAVVGLFALAREARKRATSEDPKMWHVRLKDLEIRAAGLLVEMGDAEGAARMLEGVKERGHVTGVSDDEIQVLAGRLILLYLHIGNVGRAQEILDEATKINSAGYASSLMPLIRAANGEFEAIAADTLEDAEQPMLTQNLAVCFMYSGQLEKAKEILAKAVTRNDESAFPTLLFNLATMFELTTDKARDMKLELGRRLLERKSPTLGIESSIADLKL